MEEEGNKSQICIQADGDDSLGGRRAIAMPESGLLI